MNIVEFALKMKDMASQPLRQFGTAANQTFNRSTQMANNLTSHNKVLGQSYNQLHHNIGKVENTIRTSTIPSHIAAARRELDKLQKQANAPVSRAKADSSGGEVSGGGLMGMIGGVGGLLKGAAIGLGITALTTFSSGIFDSISKGLERQQIQTSFNVLAGSEEKGGALTSQLVGLQKDTILGGEVFQNAQTMMGFGFNSEEIYDNLKMLGDVSMGDAQKLGSLTLAFSQIRAGGKLTGGDLLQLINAGFNPLEAMAQRTGKSVGVLKDEMSKGLISFGMVQQAFKDATGEGGRFENMLGKIAETPAGKIQQLSGEWDEFKTSAGAAMMPLVSLALGLAQKVMPIIEGLIAPLTSGVQNIVSWIKQAASSTNGWMGYISIIRDLMGNYILPVISKVWNYIQNAVVKFTEFVGKSELIKDIFKVVVDQVKVIYTVMSWLMDRLQWQFDNVIMPILEAIEKAYRWIKGSEPVSDTPKPNPTPQSAPDDKKNMQTTQQLLGDIAKNTADNSAAAKGTESAITAGGQKVINISVAKFLDYITINPISMSEGEADIENMFLEMFSRVVTQGGR